MKNRVNLCPVSICKRQNEIKHQALAFGEFPLRTEFANPLEPGPAAVPTADAMIGAEPENQSESINHRINEKCARTAQAEQVYIVTIAHAAMQHGSEKT